MMFSHFLVPISGDILDHNHLHEISHYARKAGAAITLAYISDPMVPHMYMEGIAPSPFTEQSHKASCEAFAQKLFTLAKSQLGDDLTIHTSHSFHPFTFEGIIQSAEDSGADVIVMASHKRKGLSGIFMGSETHAVIVHTTLPVLVI